MDDITASAPSTPAADILEAALAYARRGIPVLPTWWIVTNADGTRACACGRPNDANGHNPGKHARTPNGVHDASLNEATIRGWWDRWPMANAGAACGYGVSVVDIDTAAQEAVLRRLIAEHGKEWPATTARSRSGRANFKGRHVWVATPEGTRGCQLDDASRLQIRGLGQYAILPPSRHLSGGLYAWEPGRDLDSLEPAPAWLLTVIATGTELDIDGGPIAAVPPPARIARDRELKKALEAARDAVVGERSTALYWVGHAALRAGRRARYALDQVTVAGIVKAADESTPRPKYRGRDIEYTRISLKARQAMNDDKPTTETPELPWRTAAELEQEVPETVDWICEPWVAAGVHTDLSGKMKAAGKSTWIGAMVKAVVTGGTFLGQQAQQGDVIWLTEEGHTTFRELLARTGLLGEHRLHILRVTDMRAAGLSWPEMIMAARKKAAEVGARLIIVDTLSRWTGISGDDENSAGVLLELAVPIEDAKVADCLSFLTVRHTRKAGGDLIDAARGGNATSGVGDIILGISPAGGQGHANRRVIEGMSRLNAVPAITTVDWIAATGTFALVGNTAAPETDAVMPEVERILTERGPSTVTELCAALPQRKKGTIVRALKLLQTNERVTTGTRRGNAPIWSIVLVNPQSTDRSDQPMGSGIDPIDFVNPPGLTNSSGNSIGSTGTGDDPIDLSDNVSRSDQPPIAKVDPEDSRIRKRRGRVVWLDFTDTPPEQGMAPDRSNGAASSDK